VNKGLTKSAHHTRQAIAQAVALPEQAIAQPEQAIAQPEQARAQPEQAIATGEVGEPMDTHRQKERKMFDLGYVRPHR
jgi:hypothetical protein